MRLLPLLVLSLAGCASTPPSPPAPPPPIEVVEEPPASAVAAAPAAAPEPCAYGHEAACQQRCEAGDEASCGLLAAMYANAAGVSANPEEARRLAELGCAEQDARACNVLGYLLERGLGGATDPRRALELFERACAGGEMRGCYNLGRAHHYGISGAPKDDARAAVLFVRACQAGLPPSCSAAASLADSDPQAQLRYHEIACRGGDDDGCRGLVKDLARAHGAQPDATDLLSKLETECQGGSAQACKGLGDLQSVGLSDGWSSSASSPYYERACKLGSADGCARRGGVLLDEGATGADREQALKWLRDGCAGSDIWACLRLRRLDGSAPGADAPL